MYVYNTNILYMRGFYHDRNDEKTRKLEKCRYIYCIEYNLSFLGNFVILNFNSLTSYSSKI